MASPKLREAGVLLIALVLGASGYLSMMPSPASDASPAAGSADGQTVYRTIEVSGSNSFKMKAAQAANTLCPCFAWTVESGELKVDSIPFGEDEKEELCDCFRNHTVGCNLLDDLVRSDSTVMVSKTTDGNSQDGDPGITVDWNPDDSVEVETSDGKHHDKPPINLGHELIHAHHEANGNDRTDAGVPGGLSDEEVESTKGENQIRDELGLPDRTEYGSNAVDTTQKDTTLDASMTRWEMCDGSGGEVPSSYAETIGGLHPGGDSE